jgi:phosphoribosyl-ATP pyrophosphohydrolase/phosphoribosyl-AMP cyclohydrolase
MSYKKLIPNIYLKDETAFTDTSLTTQIGDGNPVAVATHFSENGADEIIVMDLSYDDDSHDKAIGVLRQITKSVDTPVIVGGNVKRVEDVKKYLYAGAKAAFLEDCKESNLLLMKEAADRFGSDKLGILYSGVDKDAIVMAKDYQLAFVLMTNVVKSNLAARDYAGIPVILETETDLESKLVDEAVCGITGRCVNAVDYDFMKTKTELAKAGVCMNTFESSIPFSEFKLSSDGLIPVVVQDYKTDEVLMLAYMNEEAYQCTIETGKMTYFSRSRNEIWIKGLTSGHFQYVRSIEIDCDNDTLLAKVKQVGAACHTGNRSCFYRNLVATEYAETNPLKVFNSVMSVIEDRKQHPKEGSYTNYLFDKGIDKILKKCGEEATEIIIAAKNPDPEEIKYEISDFLYHVMVLMVLRGVTWEDIVKELANR